MSMKNVLLSPTEFSYFYELLYSTWLMVGLPSMTLPPGPGYVGENMALVGASTTNYDFAGVR
jgi:hypothetical protein